MAYVVCTSFKRSKILALLTAAHPLWTRSIQDGHWVNTYWPLSHCERPPCGRLCICGGRSITHPSGIVHIRLSRLRDFCSVEGLAPDIFWELQIIYHGVASGTSRRGLCSRVLLLQVLLYETVNENSIYDSLWCWIGFTLVKLVSLLFV